MTRSQHVYETSSGTTHNQLLCRCFFLHVTWDDVAKVTESELFRNSRIFQGHLKYTAPTRSPDQPNAPIGLYKRSAKPRQSNSVTSVEQNCKELSLHSTDTQTLIISVSEMATRNRTTFVCFLVGINLLLCCCPDSSLASTSNSDGGIIAEGDVVSSSRTRRQLLMPAPYTAGLLTNYQQRPPNFFDHWLHAPSSISTLSSDGKLFDETLPSARQQQQYPCGRGPATPPQRTTVGIIGGSEAVPNSWPFIVALRNKDDVFCAGSLISPDKVLTAAHCFEKQTSYDISRMTVSLGMHTVGDGKTTENDSQMTRRISKVVMHDAYNGVTTVNDIAILTLESPVVYIDAISPVCLAAFSNDADQYAGKDITIIGWGRTSPSAGVDKFPDTLQQATIKAITNLECQKTTPTLTTNMFCLQRFGKGTCSGDSGGPVIVQSATGAWTQVGIVSFGQTVCGFLPSINTRVSAYRSWIINNM